MEITRLNCPHCEGTGTCRANNDKSCGTCLQAAKVKNGIEIVRCDVCEGIGKIEPKTERLRGRVPFLIVATVLLAFYLYSIVNAFKGEKFDQIFPLIGSLTTMIVTFYFSKKE